MEENNVNVAEPMNEGVENPVLPTKVSPWTKIKNFLFQDITVELTPKQEKVFKEVHDFWHQDITGQDVKGVLLHEVTWEGVKNFWLQDIEITL